MRQFYEAVAFDQHFLWSDASLRLLADPRATPCLGPNLPLGAKTLSACPVVADCISMPRKAAVVPLDGWLPSLVSAWNPPECEASSVPVAPRYFDVNMAEWNFADACFGVVWERKFFQRHLLLIFLVERSPFLKTLTETGSSVAADHVVVQSDSLESVICPGLHDSAVSCYQVFLSSVCLSVTFQIVTALKVLKGEATAASVGSEGSGVLV